MTGEAVTLDLALDVSQDEARRYLGYPTNDHMSARAAERLAACWPEALTLLAPRGAYRVVARTEAESAGMPEPADVVAVGVCTIGPGIEEEVARRTRAGALLDALVLDAIGSAAAEAAADALNLELCAVAKACGVEAAPRVSPGYGTWDTARQRELLALLPIETLGISLTSGVMMVPRKSVSFAVSFEPVGAAAQHGASRCALCGLPNCRHRIAPAECG